MIYTLFPINIGSIVQLILNIVHLKQKIMPILSRFQQYNIRASLDKLALRNHSIEQTKKISTPGHQIFSIALTEVSAQMILLYKIWYRSKLTYFYIIFIYSFLPVTCSTNLQIYLTWYCCHIWREEIQEDMRREENSKCYENGIIPKTVAT